MDKEALHKIKRAAAPLGRVAKGGHLQSLNIVSHRSSSKSSKIFIFLRFLHNQNE